MEPYPKKLKKELWKDIFIGIGILTLPLAIFGNRTGNFYPIALLILIGLVILIVFIRQVIRYQRYLGQVSKIQNIANVPLSNPSIEMNDVEKAKWYNNKSRLALSILFWPALIYGVIKTQLLSTKRKLIYSGLVIGLFIIIIAMPDKSSDSGPVGRYFGANTQNSTTVEYSFGDEGADFYRV